MEITKDDIYEFYELEYKISQLKEKNPDHPDLMKMEGRFNEVCNKLQQDLIELFEAYFKWVNSDEGQKHYEYDVADDILNDLKNAKELGDKISSISEGINWSHTTGYMLSDLIEPFYGFGIHPMDEFLSDLSLGKFIPRWDLELEKIIESKQETSEKKILTEGFLKNFLTGVLAYQFAAGSEKILRVKELEKEKKDTQDVIKKDKELKKLMSKFSESSAELYSYVRKRKDKSPGYFQLYLKLSEFY